MNPLIPSFADKEAPKGPSSPAWQDALRDHINFENLEGFYELALIHRDELSLPEVLFLVFAGWKLGRLTELELILKVLPSHFSGHEIGLIQKFLEAHQLRIRGDLEAGFKILEKLQRESVEWLIRYRFVSECIAFYDVHKASAHIEKVGLTMPPWAQSVLMFNLGIVALNQGHHGLFQSVIDRFSHQETLLSRYFYNWLQAGQAHHLEQNQKSVDFYLEAIELISQLPNRKTDLPILAFAALQQTVWAGDRGSSQKCWGWIEFAAQNKMSLSVQSHSLAKAINTLNEGQLGESLLRFESLFENTSWSKDHLRAGEIYFWILIAQGEFIRGKRLVQLLTEIRESFGLSLDHSLYPIYQVTFSLLNFEIAINEFQKKILREIDRLQILGVEKGVLVARFLLRLLDDDISMKCRAFADVKSIPFLQRMGLSILAKSRIVPSVWRSIRESLTDDVALILHDLHLSRLLEDLPLFVQSMKRLNQNQLLPWAKVLDGTLTHFNLEFGKALLTAELVIDGESRRVIAVQNLETLDAQPLLAELLVQLYRHPNGLNKEMACLGIGYSQYDPLQHDPIIYNLVSRLRDWMRKQYLSMSVTLGRNGWSLTHRELALGFFVDDLSEGRDPQTPKEASKSMDLPPRLHWIMLTVEKKGFIERNDLMRRFPIQKSTAANDFNRLIELGLIIRNGSGRGIYYTLKEHQ